MKYLLCPDSYKEAASALQVAQAMERGLKRASSSAVCDLAPFADGGEGFVLAMLAGGGRQIECEVTGPLG
ncbi:MAG: glycerate kinase, partial [Armatimonadota bacterium]